MERKKRLSFRGREAYKEGLKRYQKKGIPVLIDGEVAEESQFDRIFEIREDGSFYMGDYVLEDIPEEQGVISESGEDEKLMFQEAFSIYGGRKRLKEIRFELVYNR